MHRIAIASIVCSLASCGSPRVPPDAGGDTGDASVDSSADVRNPDASCTLDAADAWRCPSGCADLDNDPVNCGACGMRCTSDQLCQSGACQNACVSTERFCAGSCVNPRTDRTNCGGCGVVCATGQACAAGVCAASSFGAPCATSIDCGSDLFCLPAGFGWTGGYCSRACATSGDCDTASQCVDDGRVRFCLRRCVARTDCRDGYQCIPVAVGSVCAPSCTARPDVVCGAARCDPIADRCVNGCDHDDECSLGSTCETVSRRCRCTPATRCGDGLACNLATGSCGCVEDRVCGAGRTCDRALAQCRGA